MSKTSALANFTKFGAKAAIIEAIVINTLIEVATIIDIDIE